MYSTSQMITGLDDGCRLLQIKPSVARGLPDACGMSMLATTRPRTVDRLCPTSHRVENLPELLTSAPPNLPKNTMGIIPLQSVEQVRFLEIPR